MRPYGARVVDVDGVTIGAVCGGHGRRDNWLGTWLECADVRVGTFRETSAGSRERAKWSMPWVWDARWGWCMLWENAAGMSDQGVASATRRTHRDASLQVRRCRADCPRDSLGRGVWLGASHAVGIG